MQRITQQRYAEWIGAGLERIPPLIRARVAYADFFAGVDPFFCGLHIQDEATSDGRSYHTVACVSYGRWHQPHFPVARRRTTVVLPVFHPSRDNPAAGYVWTIVHEIGHVLDEVLGFEHTPKPVDEYAKTHRMEAFACAFEAWLTPGYPDHESLYRNDPATVALFERLAGRHR